MSIDTTAMDYADDTFIRSMRALNSMELADLSPELDQDARDLARIIQEHGKRIIQEHGKDYADTAYDDMTAPLLEALARLVQAAAQARRVPALEEALRTSSCVWPYSGDDGSVGECVRNGHCGCDNALALLES